MHIGVDIIYFSRMEHLGALDQDPFLLRCFSDRERAEAARHSDLTFFFASRFAAKEAIFKALRINGDCLRCADVEVLQEAEGYLTVHPGERMQAVMTEKCLQGVEVSISWERDLAIAAAVVW